MHTVMRPPLSRMKSAKRKALAVTRTKKIAPARLISAICTYLAREAMSEKQMRPSSTAARYGPAPVKSYLVWNAKAVCIHDANSSADARHTMPTLAKHRHPHAQSGLRCCRTRTVSVALRAVLSSETARNWSGNWNARDFGVHDPRVTCEANDDDHSRCDRQDDGLDFVYSEGGPEAQRGQWRGKRTDRTGGAGGGEPCDRQTGGMHVRLSKLNRLSCIGGWMHGEEPVGVVCARAACVHALGRGCTFGRVPRCARVLMRTPVVLNHYRSRCSRVVQ